MPKGVMISAGALASYLEQSSPWTRLTPADRLAETCEHVYVDLDVDVINTSDGPMTMYTLYGPPHHADGTVHHTKEEAKRSTEHFAGVTSE